MKTSEGKITIIVAVIGLIGTILAAVIGAKWGKQNVKVIVNIDGKSIVLKDEDVQEIADENAELKRQIKELENEISDYGNQIDEKQSEVEDLRGKLEDANEKLEDVPVIEYQNYGLSIDGEEKTINRDKSSVSINGRRYYSKDFVNNLLPSDKSAIEKDDMLYIGKVIKEKSNLLDRQMINRTNTSWVTIETNAKDTYGNIHDKSVIFVYGNNSITYNANREYEKLKCVLAVRDGQAGGGIIQIESEQGILYTSGEILSTTEPVIVDIPINQASKITIKQLSRSSNSTNNMITDAVLYNEE